MKTVAIVQARLGSARFPGKVMERIHGKPMIEVLLGRLSLSSRIDKIVLATSDSAENDPMADHLSALGYDVFRGSEQDVLDRYYRAARAQECDVVVRITGDCPLIDPEVVDKVIERYESGDVDYVSNVAPATYPDGLDAEAFSFEALEIAWREARTRAQREHVTPYIRESRRFRVTNVANSDDFSDKRWTVDEPADLDVVRAVFDHFRPRVDFGWMEVLDLYRKQPNLFNANRHLKRNEGTTLNSGQKLWKRAKRIIPGGSMLLSKRPEMFLPEQWPAYFSRAKGCRVWDLDGREYIDMSIMGVGTNVLGYGHAEVDDAVRAVVDAGTMSTLNCPDEVYLAEKLIELHPWAEMVRLARSGGEANAIAVRIARAATGKDGIAFCGYHGWHDWYLSANLADDKNLDGHLLPGLAPAGVPRGLRGTIYPFRYNEFEELERLVSSQDIGVIKMEVQRNQPPEGQFLQKVRDLATARGLILIFDECTSGFRQTFGGLHKAYGVEPDVAIFGKTLGNGYAITAVLGRREVMESAQSTFISSTFWTERIGPAAALKTLEVMERTKSWDVITATGTEITRRWVQLAEKHGLSIDLWGLPALTGFTIASTNSLAYKTLITQEMLRKGYLATTAVYVCLEHTPDVVGAYFEELDQIFNLIRECEDGRDVMTLLDGPVCHAGFGRLN